MPDDLAVHWEATVEFLKIVTEHWPLYLADNRLVSPVARRNRLMALETERLAKASPHPVIAAGSTGTVPATARLLKTIASLPNGAVVLPGLDLTLDDESWAMLAEHPEHPQASMAELLRKLGATRAEVAYVPGSGSPMRSPARGFILPARRCARPRARTSGRNFSAAMRWRPTAALASPMRLTASASWWRRPPMTRRRRSR